MQVAVRRVKPFGEPPGVLRRLRAPLICSRTTEPHEHFCLFPDLVKDLGAGVFCNNVWLQSRFRLHPCTNDHHGDPFPLEMRLFLINVGPWSRNGPRSSCPPSSTYGFPEAVMSLRLVSFTASQLFCVSRIRAMHDRTRTQDTGMNRLTGGRQEAPSVPQRSAAASAFETRKELPTDPERDIDEADQDRHLDQRTNDCGKSNC